MKTLTFSKLQQEEMLYRISVREDDIEMDADSADEFEAIGGNLNALKEKIAQGGPIELNEYEVSWINQELENSISIAQSNGMPDEKYSRASFVKSMTELKNKIQ